MVVNDERGAALLSSTNLSGSFAALHQKGVDLEPQVKKILQSVCVTEKQSNIAALLVRVLSAAQCSVLSAQCSVLSERVPFPS